MSDNVKVYASKDWVEECIDAKKKGFVHYVPGNSTTTGVWTGECEDITEYFDGLMIAYKPNVVGASGLTLNINNLGAIPVIRNVSTAITTHYGANSVLFLTYTTDTAADGTTTAYWKIADYDSDTKTRSSNKANTKMYIIGAASQSTSGQTTYSNKNCYIGTDNRLYSNGEVVPNVNDINTLISQADNFFNGSYITVTGVDDSGATHTWTLYGVKE